MTHSFEEMGLNPLLIETLSELGYTEPTPIQIQSIPPLMAGRDVLGQAQTGTGKTAAYSLPILNKLEGDALQVLILTPTRELATQVADAVHRYGSKMGVRVLPVYGGQAYERQISRLRKPIQIVVGTPGRTLDLIQQGSLKLHNIRFVVLDEGDEMLKMGFIEDIEAILHATPTDRQTILFSATFSRGIKEIAARYMRDPMQITIESNTMTVENIAQRYYTVYQADKVAALCRLLEFENVENTLVFTRTKASSAELAETLIERGFLAAAIHGDLPQTERERILKRFKQGQLHVLVATDVVARGIDIADLSHVINFDIPQKPVEYVHRVGRTGRAGRGGSAITLITPRERGSLKEIESFTRKPITKGKLPSREDVMQERDRIFTARIVEQIERPSGDLDPRLDILMNLGYDSKDIAAALLNMIRIEQGEAPIEEIAAIRDRETSSSSSERPQRDRGDRRSPSRTESERGNEPGMVRLKMDIGRVHGIRPGDVVYNVASKANIPGSAIGMVDIRTNETYLDVPAAHVETILRTLKRAKIRGQAVNLDRA